MIVKIAEVFLFVGLNGLLVVNEIFIQTLRQCCNRLTAQYTITTPTVHLAGPQNQLSPSKKTPAPADKTLFDSVRGREDDAAQRSPHLPVSAYVTGT
jgi:hypothetical protein